MRNWRRLGLILACGLGPAWSQQNPLGRLTGPEPAPAAAPAGSKAPAAPQSYTPDQIFNQIEISERVVRQTTERASDTPKLREIQEALPAAGTSVTTLITYSEDLLKKEPSLAQLRDLRNAWRATLERLADWQAALQSTSAQLEKDLTGLRDRESAWRRTLDEAGGNELPQSVVAQVARMVDVVDSARQKTVTQRNHVLAIRNQVSILQVKVDATLAHLDTAIEQRRADVLLKDSAPVWERGKAAQSIQIPPGGVSLDQEDMKGFLRYMQMNFLKVVAVYVATYVVILVPMLLLRRRAETWIGDDDPPMQRLGRVIRRPFSISVLLTIPIGFLLAGRPPNLALNLLGLLLLVPLIRIVPMVVSPQLARSVYLLGLLYALDRFAVFLAPFSMARRWMLLTLTIVAGAAFYWQDRRIRPEQLRVLSLGLLRFLLRGALVLLAASAILNVIGYVSLSQNVTGGVVTSLYMAILIHSSAMIAHSFAAVLLHPLKSRTEMVPPQRFARLHARIRMGITVLSLIALLLAVLGNFGVLGPTWSAVSAALSAPLNIGAIHITLNAIATFALAMFFAFVFSDLLRLFLDLAVFPRIQLQRGSAKAVSQLTNYAVLFLGFLIASSAAGLDMSKFAFLAGAIGVGVGFGLQSVVNNFVSGLILLFERPVHIGDRVTIRGGVNGIVNSIGIRASTIRTWDGADVVVPNGDLLANDLTNWTLTDSRRRSELLVGVAYGTDPNKVIEILLATAKSHPKVDRFPEPHAVFTGFGDSALNFVLRFWTHIDDQMVTSSEIHIAVNRALAEAGIEIPFPQQDVHIRSRAESA
ncbi:MAG: mechanosensitive ion channel [Bryobacterales bacterium]|nr:mechanosensitive ion channel [Bryobacterales bacterium]